MNNPASLKLVAHAATAAMRSGRFPDDDPLDERGLAEVRAVASTPPWVYATSVRVLSSPARCARDTAAALLPHADADADDALRDADYGRWRGKRLIDLSRETPAELQAWTQDPSAAPHGGESFDVVLQRIAAWMDGPSLRGHRSVIAITHAVVIRAALAHVARAAHGWQPEEVGRAACLRVDIRPLSVVTFERSSGDLDGWRLVDNGTDLRTR